MEQKIQDYKNLIGNRFKVVHTRDNKEDWNGITYTLIRISDKYLILFEKRGNQEWRYDLQDKDLKYYKLIIYGKNNRRS